MWRSRSALVFGSLIAAAGAAAAAPSPSLAAPNFAPGARTFVAFAGDPARIRVTWTPVTGATRYRAAWFEGSTRVDVELAGTVFERAEPASGSHQLSIVALDAAGRESLPATVTLDVVDVDALAPGAREPSRPRYAGRERAFAVGARFSSPGLRCRLGDEAFGAEVTATRSGSVVLACGDEAGKPHLDVPIVITPVIIATQVTPLRVGTPTIVHVAIASAAEVGDQLDVRGEGVEIDATHRTDGGLDITLTAHDVRRGADRAFVRVAAGTVELGHFDVESIAAPALPPPPAPRADWFALELGGHAGVFAPPTGRTSTNIGHPTTPGDAVGWGPLLGGRIGLFPTRHVGVEVEAGVATTGYDGRSGVSTVVLARAQLAVRVVEHATYGLRVLAGTDSLTRTASKYSSGSARASVAWIAGRVRRMGAAPTPTMCPVCRQRTAEVGVLCEECRDELSSPIKITPEQLQQSAIVATSLTEAALIDPWGRPFRLDARTMIGRQADGPGIAILEPSVSRNHATLVLANGTWTASDLGSANGTWLDDKLIELPTKLGDGDRIRFGHIGFYFVTDVAILPPPRTSRTATETMRPQDRKLPRPPADEETTDVGLPAMTFKLHEPTGGGGGLIEVDGKQVQLTTTQFELMALMIRRMASEAHQPELVRGFVRSSELIVDLSWDTREPSENHVKQLVRRVRRALLKSEIGDLIESRHRFGYRLRAIPRTG
ncbi:MAG: FHA domain-containing protein [Proteobacteria bacterium]|nr:FHA domain-containing protein [Pseudomonadota bacterium]